MRKTIVAGVVAVLGLVSGAAVAQGGYYGGGNGDVVRCESVDSRTRECPADTRNGVQLVRQLSSERCIEGRNWGVGNRFIWVAGGCRADFEVGRRWAGDDSGWGGNRLERQPYLALRIRRPAYPGMRGQCAPWRAPCAATVRHALRRRSHLGLPPRSRLGVRRLPGGVRGRSRRRRRWLERQPHHPVRIHQAAHARMRGEHARRRAPGAATVRHALHRGPELGLPSRPHLGSGRLPRAIRGRTRSGRLLI